jgi:hypothetical protein
MGGSAAADAADWAGTERYEVIGRLGQGGMGIVYEAFDRERRQLVALKKLLRYDPAALYLFKQEFRTLADVRHTNLVHLYELVVAESNETFFTMELVRGTDFLQYARSANAGATQRDTSNSPAPPQLGARPPTWERDTLRPRAPEGRPPATPTATRCMADFDRLRPALRQLVEGIHALHSAGKLHRDVKPSNVLVTPEGRLVLLDFGVATELRGHVGDLPAGSGEVVGTARYMAPEQADDAPPVPASDWYSVGVILYEVLVGRPPFVGSAIDMLTMKSMLDATAPSECVEGVPADLDLLCRALLQRDPATRPEGLEILRRLGVTRSSAPPTPIAAADPATAFIGRDAQLATLREAFAATQTGRAVTVRVGGASGMGKSTLVHHFLDDLATRSDAIVLRGRAYEREAVPYKAVDTVIDALSRHLLRVVEDGGDLELPDDVWLLARLFPVLQRVPTIGELASAPIEEPQSVRRRAFAALRALLASLAKRQPLVLFVDDAQWGDVDSAALLLDLLRAPGAPALLLVMTYRDNEAASSAFLKELAERWPEGADLLEVKVEPLGQDEAHRLVLSLLDASDEFAQRTARAVARESRGSPFLIEELVRSNRGATSATGATLAVLTLDQMVSERMERLPEMARRMIEIVAVGGRPLPVSIVAAASGAEDTVNEVIGFLSNRRFLRAGLRDGRDVVETTHDRIRETIVAQLPEAKLRANHGRLAHAFEHAVVADAEAVAVHWLGAGDTERAARFAEGAADQAATKLAFDQAARLYQLTLEHTPASSPERRRLQARLADVLLLAGRSHESARFYLEAAKGAEAGQKVEFQRAAAEQLLNGGRIDEGKEILHGVLDAVGMSAPRSPLAAVFWLLVYRVWLALVGLRVKERAPADVSREDRLRIEALSTVSLGFGVVDVILGACMQARHLIEALRAGDRFQVARAMSIEAAHVASAGAPETRRERELVRISRELAEKEGTEDALLYFTGPRGIGLFNRGYWRPASEMLDRATAVMRTGQAGFANSHLFGVYSQLFLGNFEEARTRISRLVRHAEDRGDLYVPVNLKTSGGITLALVNGEVERARRYLNEAVAQWTQTGFSVQHWQALVYGSDLDAYEGNPGRAYDRFAASMPALKKSFLLHAGFVRTMTFFARGRIAIASIADRPDLKRQRIAEARQMIKLLEREHAPWAGAVASMVRAAAENAAGDREAAMAALRVAIEKTTATDTVVYALAARIRLGEMMGGEEGGALTRAALDEAIARGAREPGPGLAIYLPGTWSVPR